MSEFSFYFFNISTHQKGLQPSNIAVKVSWNKQDSSGKETCYFGWTGGISSTRSRSFGAFNPRYSAEDKEGYIIEVDTVLANVLNVQDGQTVSKKKCHWFSELNVVCRFQ